MINRRHFLATAGGAAAAGALGFPRLLKLQRRQASRLDRHCPSTR